MTQQICSKLLAWPKEIRLLVNEAMRQERFQALNAHPCHHTDERAGHANGFKPKTLDMRLGPITFAVPQARGGAKRYRHHSLTSSRWFLTEGEIAPAVWQEDRHSERLA